MNTELIEVEVQDKTAFISKTLIGQADDLALEHESFHTNYIVAGRIALYELLGKIYTLSIMLNDAIDKTEQISMMRSVLSEKHQIRTQDNTSDLAVLVRYITRADRKTAHVYARAIQSASESGVLPENMVSFIEHNGGIERIRAIGVSQQGSEEAEDHESEKIALSHAFLSAKTEIPFASFDAPKAFDEIYANNCTYEFVICSMSNGKYNVIGKLPADLALENLAIKYFSKYLCKDFEVAKEGIASVIAEAKAKREERFKATELKEVI
jgi:hypothetical protein